MEVTKEKLAYLLFLYKQKETNCTVTRLAEEFGVSKSTFSRVLNIFYHENLIIQKGKGILSTKGEKLAKNYFKDIAEIKLWLKNISNLSDEEAYQEALTLVLVLSNKTRYNLISDLYKKKLFEKIDKIKSISGDMLTVNLEDGKYQFAFTIYKLNKLEISMANDGFVHPGILEINNGKGNLILFPKEIEHESLLGNIILKGQVESLKYMLDQEFISSQNIKNSYIIPIDRLKFHYCKEERILQTSIKIKVRANVGIIHMPESCAVLNIILK
ncbi:NEAT domain-containing protein [Thomasclavelia sp.]|uniref:NEAT domain-containing protein n=1 Tax=Thomasclavelia sp. TaxID=3025757 RepID=UPI002618AB59|nr:NEAT domain-containing protein [Thomasclavelia sp.]